MGGGKLEHITQDFAFRKVTPHKLRRKVVRRADGLCDLYSRW
jgi:hypothetical protein